MKDAADYLAYIKALAITVGARQGCMRQDYDYVHIEENVIASRMASAAPGGGTKMHDTSAPSFTTAS